MYLLVMHGDEVQRAIFAVDVGDELRNLPFELGRVRQGRGRDLDEDDVANPLGVVLEQLLEGAKLEGSHVKIRAKSC